MINSNLIIYVKPLNLNYNNILTPNKLLEVRLKPIDDPNILFEAHYDKLDPYKTYCVILSIENDNIILSNFIIIVNGNSVIENVNIYNSIYSMINKEEYSKNYLTDIYEFYENRSIINHLILFNDTNNIIYFWKISFYINKNI